MIKITNQNKTVKVNTREYLRNIGYYFKKVRGGQKIIIMNRNQPFAELVPVNEHVKKPVWQEETDMLQVPGLNMGEEIVKNRQTERS